MSNDCGRIRDEIAGRFTGSGPSHAQERLRGHLDSCAACQGYLQALQREDALLTEYFATVDAETARRQERMRQALERVDTPQPADRISIWRGIMKSRLSRTAVAAAILVAAAVGIRHFGGRLDGTSVAWASVAEKLDQIRDFSYRQREIKSTGVRTPGFEFKQEWETWCYYSSEFGSRWDQYGAGGLIGKYYTLLKKQQLVHLYIPGKTYRCRSEPLPQTMRLDPVGEIRPILAEPYVKLGRTTINGVVVEGIEVQGQKVLNGPLLDKAVTRLWVDIETELPVWMESEGKVHGSDMYARLIRDQFRCNTGLTEADFTPVIPPDFTQENWRTENSAERPDIALAAQEPVVVDFGPLQELGLLSDDEILLQPTQALTGMKEIHAARDEVMGAWPKYADMRDSLQQELDQKLDLKSCSVDELVRYGVLLREKYWDVGGDLSPTSYRYGYMARILLETAYAREPNDLTIGDELAEAIMSVETMRMRETFWPALRELRAAQFRLTRAEVESGRPPVWADFARGCDMTYLFSWHQGPEEGVPAVDWLIAHARAGGWTAYLDLLEKVRAELAKEGNGAGYNIYLAAGSRYPEEFRYGGRLPSFRGPAKRVVVPSHPLQPPMAPTEE